jgi:hypothetical protein
MRYKHPILITVNKIVMQIQYVIFMMIFFFLFAIVSVALIPLAYIVGIVDKIKSMNSQPSTKAKIENNFLFFPFGIAILSMDVLFDFYYFWKNNFRPVEDLKQIIIVKEKSEISHTSIRELMNMSIKYSMNKIKSTNTSHIVKVFTKDFKVINNLQFLIFGQMIPLGGWGDGDENMYKGFTLKTMKTQELEEQRMIELNSLDDTAQIMDSKSNLK